MRLDNFAIPDQGLIAIIMLEHIGDIIACEPVIGYAKRSRPDRPVAWVTLSKYAELLEAHPRLDYLLFADSLVDADRWACSLPENCWVINLHFHQRPCPVTGVMVRNSNNPAINKLNYYDHGSLLEVFSKCAGLPPLTDAPRFYMSDKVAGQLPPTPYVVFHCQSNDTNRDWDPDKWRKLFEYFTERNIAVAEIGLTPVINSPHPLYFDLTADLSLQQIAILIDSSYFFFGVDSGFAHMANALGKEGLIIMGAYGKWNNHIPYTGLYSINHIVRHPLLPARYLSLEEVIARYVILLVSQSNQTGATDTISRQFKPACGLTDDLNTGKKTKATNDGGEKNALPYLSFPNFFQKMLIKIYRPLAKRDTQDEYQLFKANPRLYFMIPGRDSTAKKAIRIILKLTGGVPSKIHENNHTQPETRIQGLK